MQDLRPHEDHARHSTPTPSVAVPANPEAEAAGSNSPEGAVVQQHSDAPAPPTTDTDPADETPKTPSPKKRRTYRTRNTEAYEQRIQGRGALCRGIADIAPKMLKIVKLRILAQHLDSKKGLDDEALTERIRRDVKRLSSKDTVLSALYTIDPDVDRRNLKWIILFTILLQEETYALEERRLEEKVIEFEKSIVASAKALDFFDPKKHDQTRWNYYSTYRIVLEAAWRNEDDISPDEAQLLRVLRDHMSISMQEHWLISAHLKRFPKKNCELHTRSDIHDARKQLQREGLLWSLRDDNNRDIDVIPAEIAGVLRRHVARMELQRTNYLRVLQHDSIRLDDLRTILIEKGMDRYGNKDELIRRIVDGDLQPSAVLNVLDRAKLAEMCRQVGLKSSGTKPELIQRLIEFYDDLTFQERTTKDEREVWYGNYELLASRRYADLKAKKVINRDLDIEHLFEAATDFLFQKKLRAKIDKRTRGRQADGRILLDRDESILWDCKSVEKRVNLQDHLDAQFDNYLRRERERGHDPIVFLVIGPDFTPQSLAAAHQYKARTNWDIALVTAGALKLLADRWSSTEPSKPFPVRLFNRTELIDEDKVELLLSLA